MNTKAISTNFDDLHQLLRSKWETGWLPRDLVAVFDADRKLARSIVIDLVAFDRQSWHADADPVWADHADYLGANIWWDVAADYWPQLVDRTADFDAVDTNASMLAHFMGLPGTDEPVFHPMPWEPAATGRAEADTRVLDKVRGLLAKAESTTFPDEAEALSAKAQELIARHSIDLALLAADVDVPGGRKIYVEPPYPKPKFQLLAEVAAANDCRAVWSNSRKTATVIGHQGDLDLTDLLFTSLLIQGTRAILNEGAKRDQYGTARTKSWRNAFWFGYAYRIGERLREASAAVRSEAADDNAKLLPVLACRSEEVDRVVEETFPNLGSLKVSVSNSEGIRAGRQHADRADIGGNSVGGGTAALTP